MNLLYVETARTMWMFDIRTLDPHGLDFQPVFNKIVERYRFSKFPKNALDRNDQNALAFEEGSFGNSQGKAISVTFAIYGNGIAAQTQSNTKDATEFLKDLSASIVQEFGLVDPSGQMTVGYLSQLVVVCDKPLISLNQKIENILGVINSHYRPLDGKSRIFGFGGISCWTEDVGQSQNIAPVPFRFERKWGTPFSSNQYFSIAPLETEAHLELLQELEKLLS